MVKLVLAVALGSLTCACQGDALDEAEHIAGWANSASALGVYTHGYEPIAFADGQQQFADPACPVTTDDGTTVAIAGDGCIDSEGDQFFGAASVVRTATGVEVTFDQYGHARDGGAVGRLTGTFDASAVGVDLYSFDAELTSTGGIVMSISYSGTVAGTYDGPTVWNGSGTISREGAVINDGVVTATTVDQLRDNDICSGESISGTTTLVSDEHTVVITYDGATDCDDDNSARWSRDGVDQGFVTGVACAASPANGSGATTILLIGLALLVSAGLRRAG